MSGEIRDFRNPPVPSSPGPKILSVNQTTEPEDVQVLDSRSQVEPTTVDLRVHEEIHTEGEDKIRSAAVDPAVEIRLREGKTNEKWDRVKRLEDE